MRMIAAGCAVASDDLEPRRQPRECPRDGNRRRSSRPDGGGLSRALARVALIASLFVAGCERATVTPPEIEQQYAQTVASLDKATPGASVARLKELARTHASYAIAARIDAEIAAWRAELDATYLRARDLVRAERFDEAEALLNDLAKVPDERAGKSAKTFLSFEFHQIKAASLLRKGNATGADAVARALRTKPLTEEQQAANERLLDQASMVDKHVRMTHVTALQSAARSVMVYLHSTYADDGQYPPSLSLDSPGLASLRSSGALDTIARIEGYTSSVDAFSLVVVGKDPTMRLRITQRGIEAMR